MAPCTEGARGKAAASRQTLDARKGGRRGNG